MFEVYKDSQEEFYNTIFTSVCKNNKISHAYLIDVNNFADASQLVMSFAKFLICKNHKINNSNCDDCNICSLIDNGTDNHIKIIKPDGMWIKKEQLANLKDELSMKTVDGFSQIYIIYEAEKLNKSAANSLLKFIEEPEEGIIAILVSNNRYKILPTILSRCQIHCLKNSNQEEVDDFEYQDMVDFVMNLERNGCHTICYMQDLWHSKYKTKEEIFNNFNKLENIFIDLIHSKLKNTDSSIVSKIDYQYILSKNEVMDLVFKLSKINECKEQIQYNANLSLLMDKFIIEYVGGDCDG